MINMRKIGLRVKARRMALSLSLTDLHLQCGISHSTISQLERGIIKSLKPHLFSICYALGMDMYTLIDSCVYNADRDEFVKRYDDYMKDHTTRMDYKDDV